MDKSTSDASTDYPAAESYGAAITSITAQDYSPRAEALDVLISIAQRISTIFEHGGPTFPAESREEESESGHVTRALRSTQRPRRPREPISPLEFQLRALSRTLLAVFESLDSPFETARLLSFLDNAVSGAQLAHAGQSITRAKRATLAQRRNPTPDYAAVDVERVAADIVAIEQRCTVREAAARVRAGLELESKLPKIWARVRGGEMHATTARKIASAVRDVEDPAKRARIENVILNRMDRDDSPLEWSRRVARHLDLLIADVDPDAARKAEDSAFESRRLSTRSSGKGMASLTATLPALDCASVLAKVKAYAKRWSEAPSEARSEPQLEADALVHLLAGIDKSPFDQGPGAPQSSATAVAPIHPRISILADVAGGTLAVRGWAAGTAFIRERLDSLLNSVERAHLQVVPLGHDDEAPSFSDLTARLESFTESLGRQCTYAPAPSLRRAIVERDGTCRHPGCTHPAERCDLDHVVPFDHSHPLRGGLTREDNLIALCRSHHRFKTHGKGRYVLRPDGRVEVLIGDVVAGSSMPTGHRGVMREREHVEYEGATDASAASVAELAAAAAALTETLDSLDHQPPSESAGVDQCSGVVELKAHRRAREAANRRSAASARRAESESFGTSAFSLDGLEF